MSGLRRIGLSCALLAGCDPGDDIVARPATTTSDAGTDRWIDASFVLLDAGHELKDCCDAGLPGASGFADAGAPSPWACSATDRLLLLTKEGRLFHADGETGRAYELGMPACPLPIGSHAAAVDMAGKLWVAPAVDGVVRVIEPGSLSCEETALKMTPTAMAFVYDPVMRLELLYALDAAGLSVIDPQSLAPRPRGTLEPSWLAGTADGSLFAVSDRAGGVVTIGAVSAVDASVQTLWKVLLPSSSLPLSGAAMQPGGFTLIFGAEVYRWRTGEENAQPVGKLSDSLGSPTVVATAPCMTLPK